MSREMVARVNRPVHAVPHQEAVRDRALSSHVRRIRSIRIAGTPTDTYIDEGWGRGRQPVIRSFVDTTRWNTPSGFSLQTGQTVPLTQRGRVGVRRTWLERIPRIGGGTHVQHRVWRISDGSDSRWGGKQASPVGSFPANPFGLHDTAGNVLEMGLKIVGSDKYDGARDIDGCGMRRACGSAAACWNELSGEPAIIVPGSGVRRRQQRTTSGFRLAQD